MQITVKIIEQKEGQRGPYTRIQDENGVWRSCFTGIEFKQGLAYEVEIEQKGNFENIITAKPLTMSQAGQPVAQPTPSNGKPAVPMDKDLTIVREVCVKGAVEFAGYKIQAGVDIGSEEVVQVSKRFEKYVTTGA